MRGAMTTLSELQRRLYDALNSPPDTDVEIYKLYEATYNTSVHAVTQGVVVLGLTPRTMQQRLGPVIARVNEKLQTGRVVPGERKQTYRLDLKAV